MLPLFRKPGLDVGVPMLGMVLVGLLPGPLKRFYYRCRGARIGKGVALGLFSYIESPEIVLGDGAALGHFSFIRARTRCVIGARSRIHMLTAIDTGTLQIGEDTAIREQVVVAGMPSRRSSLKVGSRTKIFPFTVIDTTEAVTIGDEVCVGGGSYIFSHSSWQSMLDGFPAKFGAVNLGNRSWLAWRGFVMPGVTIGEEATIGGGAVVTQNIPARTLAVGVPAKPVKTGDEYIRPLTPEEQRRMVRQWLHEFADFLQYTDTQAALTTTATGVFLQTALGTVAYREQPGENVHADILLSFPSIDAAERAAYAGWFDMASRQCKIDGALAQHLREFLIRYGLRFVA